jgi:uncharacterized protein RhaS with RHS repeats
VSGRVFYNWHRDYSPSTGNYPQADPIGQAGGLNLYTYGLNNPVSYTDPNGLTPLGLAIGVGVRVIGGRAAAAAIGAGARSMLGPTAGGIAACVLAGVCSMDAANDESGEGAGETAPRPPTGSKPIDQTPWSGDHRDIKHGVGAGAADHVSIAPNGDVWVQNPDGSWTNYGPASDYTGSGKASGRKGKDRKRNRECP